ncbi:MAG: helix-turn-helix transcriptional regulator [Clostridia bacterium]|nr:helix-turn-helix transcriptional regulator [Clostridia bacterium]
MKDLRKIIAKNICALRTDMNITQLQLAEMLNYSDKAVSKWERGVSQT